MKKLSAAKFCGEGQSAKRIKWMAHNPRQLYHG
jgi:hypothetical protein